MVDAEVVVGGLVAVGAAVGWGVRAVIWHGKQITAIEAALGNLPDKDSLHQLALLVERLNGTVTAFDERLVGLVRIVDRHERYLDEERRREGGADGAI